MTKKTIECYVGCNSYADSEGLHKFISEHGNPFMTSRIDPEQGWVVTLTRIYDTSKETKNPMEKAIERMKTRDE